MANACSEPRAVVVCLLVLILCVQVGFVASICTFCFLTRAGMVFYAAFDPRDGNLDVMTHPLLNLIYYCLVELLPSALVLYILRKLPPKRSSQGYQSISTN